MNNGLVCLDCGGIYAKLRVCRECGKTVCQTCLDTGNHDIEPNPKIAGLWAAFITRHPSLTDSAYAVTDVEMAADWVRTLIRDLEIEKERLLDEKSKLEKERSHLKHELRSSRTTSER